MAIESLGEELMGIGDIQVADRLRPVSEAGVDQLVASIESLGGHMTDPIQVRVIAGQRGREARIVLMAGAHRLAAARRLGWSTIRARRWRCNDDEARIFEIDDNLASADLIALDRAVFMAARQEAYLRLHPETAQGGDRRNKVQNDMMSFCSATAETFGKSTRWAERYVMIGRNLSPEEVARLRDLPAAKQFSDLLHLAKMPPERRAPVIDTMASRGASVAAAVALARGPVAEPDPVDKAYQDLLDRFKRAPMAAKRRFLSQLLAMPVHARVVLEEVARAGAEAPDE